MATTKNRNQEHELAANNEEVGDSVILLDPSWSLVTLNPPLKIVWHFWLGYGSMVDRLIGITFEFTPPCPQVVPKNCGWRLI